MIRKSDYKTNGELKVCTVCGNTAPEVHFTKTNAQCNRCRARRMRRSYRNLDKRAQVMLKNARYRADKKGVRCTIDVDFVREKLDLGYCEVTGIRFDYTPHSPFIPTLERIDSTKGYEYDNVVVAVWIYNRAKGAEGMKFLDHFVRSYATSKVRSGEWMDLAMEGSGVVESCTAQADKLFK